MKNNWIKLAAVNIAITAFMLMGSSSCQIADQTDLNAPSVEAIEANATVSELNNVVLGMLSSQRLNYDFYLDDCAVIGRDWYRFSSADPRFVSDLPGTCGSVLDANTFYIVNPWTAFYRTVRNGWVLRNAVANTSAPLTEEQKNGYNGIAKTIQALEMIWISNLTYTNSQGCLRVDVQDPDNLGPLVNYDDALSSISSLLDDGYDDLQNAGDAFLSDLSTGFIGFNTPATFAQFNRALKARVDVYQQDWQGALDDLALSFYNLSGDMNTGCYISYSTESGDIANNVYIPVQNQASNARVTPDFWVNDAEPGDLRLSKVVQRSALTQNRSVCAPGDTSILSSNYDVAIWHSQDDDIAIIRNEELILIGAEAKIQLGDLAGGTANLDAVREAAGLPGLGNLTQPELVDQMLTERRYSLFGEGHRWVDMRRYNRLDQIETETPDQNVWDYFPVPAFEIF